MKKYSPYILFGILFLLYFVCYETTLWHIVYYHDQHELFLYTKQYFTHCIHTRGWLTYITCFIIQFFHIHWLGSVILSLLLALGYLLADRIIRLVTGRSDMLRLAVIPSAILFLHSITIDNKPDVTVGGVLALSAVCLVAYFLRRRFPSVKLFPRWNVKPRLYLIISLLCLIAYGKVGYNHFKEHYKTSEHMMLMSERFIREKNWDKALEYTDRYLTDSKKTNSLITYFRNLALAHKGLLAYHFLDYPSRLGVKALYFPWEGDSRKSEYGHLIYEDIGSLNAALHWETEALVAWGETAQHLSNLARYNIAIKRPTVAKRYIDKLKSSLFHHNEAVELEKVLYTGKVPGLKNAYEHIQEDSVRFINVLDIAPELEYICRTDTTNKMAYDYLMAHLLLSNQVTVFVDKLKCAKSFGYTTLPPAYEEALYAYKLGTSEAEFAQAGMEVSPETEQRFKRYYALIRNRQRQALRSEFGNSYWFYLNYVSPYGNQNSPK